MQLRIKEVMSEQLLPKIGNIYFAAFSYVQSLQNIKNLQWIAGLSDPALLLPGA